MTKTLVYVPRMYSKEEFIELLGAVPSDFDKQTKEFWEYVSERVTTIASRIRWIFINFFPKDDMNSLAEESVLVKRLVEKGAKLRVVQDPMLYNEAKAWLEMTKTSPNDAVIELFEESLREMSEHTVNTVYQALQNGDLGLLFMTPRLKPSFPADLKVIRLIPFDPRDYLRRNMVRLGSQ